MTKRARKKSHISYKFRELAYVREGLPHELVVGGVGCAGGSDKEIVTADRAFHGWSP